MTSVLYQQIQQLYDKSSGLWEQIWGEHMHHGYYGPNGTLKKERRQAQIDLIEEFLNWGRASVNPELNPEFNSKSNGFPQILDVGCGIGGSTLYLAEKFMAEATGITLSPVQANRARERAIAPVYNNRSTSKLPMLSRCHWRIIPLTWFGRWRAGNTCPTKSSFFRSATGFSNQGVCS